MAAAKRRRYDDDDSFAVSIKKEGSSNTVLLVGLIVGGTLLAFLCAGSLGIALLVAAYQPEQPAGTQPDVFLGSWKGPFLLHGQQRDVVYTFEKSGRWSETQFTPGGQRVTSSSGRWGFQNGQITINFDGGASESANAVFMDGDTIDYLIVRHNDGTQIGLRTTFRRQ